MMFAGNQTTDYKISRVLKNINYLRITVKIHENKYKDMADSTIAARNYLISRYKEDYLENSTVQSSLNSFLSDSGIT